MKKTAKLKEILITAAEGAITGCMLSLLSLVVREVKQNKIQYPNDWDDPYGERY